MPKNLVQLIVALIALHLAAAVRRQFIGHCFMAGRMPPFEERGDRLG